MISITFNVHPEGVVVVVSCPAAELHSESAVSHETMAPILDVIAKRLKNLPFYFGEEAHLYFKKKRKRKHKRKKP